MLRSLRAGGTGMGNSKKALLIGAALAAVAIALIAARAGSATQAPIEMNFACALKSNGLTRYVSNLNQCKNTELRITVHAGPSIALCVNPDGSVRDIPPRQCKKPGFVLTIPPASGTVYFCAKNTTGTLRYVTDPSQCDATEFPVMVNPNNHPPVAVADSYSTDEDTPLTVPAPGVLANDTDADGDPLTAVLVSGPSHAASFALNADGSFNYTPASNYNGSDSFTYKDNDTHTTGNTVTVSLTINAVNDAPMNNLPPPQSVDEDSSLVFSSGNGNQISVSDVDAGSASTFQVTLTATHGALTFGASSATTFVFSGTLAQVNADLDGLGFTPDLHYSGPASISMTSNDGGATGSGGAQSDTDTLSITVNHVNHPPVATDDAYSTSEDTPLTVSAPGVLVNDSDVDGDTLHAVLVSGPSHAAPSGFTLNADGSFSYTPASNYNGSDGFTYKANDGTADSNIVTVSLTINPVNDPPVANDDSASTDEDTPLTVPAPGVLGNDTDVDGDSLHAVLESGPSHAASFTLNSDGSYSYTPAADFNGTDTFTYKASDGNGGSDGATVTITVNAVNDAPVNTVPAGPITAHQGQDTPIGGISVTDVDAGSDDIQMTLSVDHGTVTVSTSVLGGVGPLAVTGNGTATAVVTASQSAIDTTLADANGLTYHPDAAYTGPDTLTVSTDDLGHTGSGGAKSDTDTVGIDVPANSAPTDIQLSSSSIAENQPSGTDIGTLTTTDPDVGDTHTYTLENTGCGGGPFPDNSSFQIGGVNGDKVQSAASFDFETKSSYTVCVRSTDNGSLSFDKQFTISITNVNEAPTDISLDNNSIDENKPSGSLVGNLSQVGDPDSGETYTFTLLTSGCSGSFPDSSSFQVSGSQLQSAVSFNFEVKNSYTICVRVNDPGSPSLSFEKQFTISINDVNDNPVDGNESVNAVGNTLLEYGSVPSPSAAPKKVLAGNLLANATDEDQPPQTLTISASDSTSANGGDVSVSSSGAFSYVPKAGFTGTDTFNYTVSDGNGGTDTSTVTITVASRVWYVKNNATAGGTGRSTDPFDTLAEADTAANATGDITYVYKGDGTTTGLTGGFSLLASQKLLGEPVNLVVGADTLATGTPANRPSISGTVALASGSRVEAVDIAGSAGAAIAGTNTGGSDVTNVNLSGGAGGVALTGAAAGTFNFTNFAITTTGGTGFLVNSSGAPTINVGSGSTENVSATGGPAVDVRNANSASNLTFDAVSSTNSSGAGINLDSNGATPFSASSGSISGAAGNAIDVNGGSGNVTYPGTLGNGAGGTADITGRTGGAISLSGDINDTNDAGGGITMSGNTGGSTTFSGTTKTLNTGASAAFSSTGSGQTITFSGGGLNIDTTSGAGFSATGGGTVNVTGTVNTIDSTTGTALTVSSTNIGASGLTFEHISANGAANGIVLNATGSSGSLSVTGNGGTSVGGDGSGGTIQNTSGAGISLTNTTFPYFLNMNIQNTAGSGINGTQVTHFNFQFGTINNSGTGGAADDSNISFNDSTTTPNVTGDVHITGSVLTNARYHGVDIQNSTGTISLADITDNTFTSSTSVANSLGSAVRLIALGSASGVANVTKANLDNNTISNFPSGAGFVVQGGNAADVSGAPAGTMGVPGSGTNIISIDGNKMDGGLGGVGNQPDRFVTATVNGRGQGNFDISNNGTVLNPITHIDGVVIELSEFGDANVTATTNGNRIVANNAVGSAGIGIGCDSDSLTTTGDTGTLTSTIDNNTVSLTDGPGIFAIARNSNCTMNAKIQNNTVAAPATTNAARAGIRVDSGSSAGDTTLCLNISGNTTAGSTNTGTATTSPGINLRKQGTVTTTNSFAINGMAATASPGVENYVNGLNTSTSGTFGVGGTALLSATSGFSNCTLP